MSREELEAIIASDKAFYQYIEQADESPDGATVSLIQCVIEQDGEAWEDYEAVYFVAEICQMFKAYSNRKVEA